MNWKVCIRANWPIGPELIPVSLAWCDLEKEKNKFYLVVRKFNIVGNTYSRMESCRVLLYTRFQSYVHKRHLHSSFDMLYNGCWTVKQAIFHIISRRNDKKIIITDRRLKKFVNIACVQIYRIIKRLVCSQSAAQWWLPVELGR